MKVLDTAEPFATSDFWYDLTSGGYIKPEELVVAEDAKKVNAAIAVIQEFEKTLEEAELLEEM